MNRTLMSGRNAANLDYATQDRGHTAVKGTAPSSTTFGSRNRSVMVQSAMGGVDRNL